MRTRSPLSPPISNPPRSTATRPSCRRCAPSPGVALEPQSVCLHHPADPLGVDGRTDLFAVPAPDQCMDPPVAVARQPGDDLLDLSQQFCLRLRRPRRRRSTAAVIWAARFERASPSVSATRFTACRPMARRASTTAVFWLYQIQRLAQDLVLQCLLAEQPLQSRI